MLTAQRESYAECLTELRPLYHAHWQELALNKTAIPLVPNYSAYSRLDKAGSLLLVTLRDGAKLAGYYMGFVFPEMHYMTCLSLFTDVFRVLPEHRGAWGGVKLFRGVDAAARAAGVQQIHCSVKVHSDASAVLLRCGYVLNELGYSKLVK